MTPRAKASEQTARSTQSDAAGAEVDAQAVVAEEVKAENAVHGGRGWQRVAEDGEARPLRPQRLDHVDRQVRDVLNSTAGRYPDALGCQRRVAPRRDQTVCIDEG